MQIIEYTAPLNVESAATLSQLQVYQCDKTVYIYNQINPRSNFTLPDSAD